MEPLQAALRGIVSELKENDQSRSVLALHEVLREELGDFEADAADQRLLAEYQVLATEAAIRRTEREAMLANQKATPEQRDASCELARNAEMRCLHPIYSLLHRRQRSALCFSGGGIRSATFNLGVLQALATHSLEDHDGLLKPRLLGEFDFLSTVSGGGYIGSWFSSWVKRIGITHVLRHLSHKTAGKLDPETKPVRYLRDYTNYLNPRLGLFSGDTWALAATTVRNILLNWFVLVPFVAAGLMIPVLFTRLLTSYAPASFDWVLVLGFLCGVIGTGTLMHNLPSFGNGRQSEKVFVLSCLLPLKASAICMAIWWCWLTPAQASALPTWKFIAYGGAMHLGGVLVGVVLSLLSRSENFKPAHIRPTFLFAAGILAIFTGALGAWLASLMATRLHPPDGMDILHFACFVVPVVAMILSTTGVFAVGVSSKITTDDDREWWSRGGGWMLVATLGWLVFFSLVLLLPPWVATWTFTAKGVMSAISAAVGWYVTQAGSKSESRPSQGSAQDAEPPGLLSRLNTLLLPAAATLFLIALSFVVTVVNQRIVAALSRAGVPFPNAWLAAFEIVFAMLASYCINVNKFSLHAMYRMRLMRAYLGASNTDRDPNPFTGFDIHDNIAMEDLRPEKPLHVLNLCLNLVSGEKLAWQQRKAESFTVTRLHSGSFPVGYQPSSQYAKSRGADGKLQGITLGTAMAISGAAASPNQGYHSSPLAAIVMTLFNARLGWWLTNPGEAGRGFWDHDGPAFGIKPFLDEALGKTDDRNRYVYLSDGGHFDNLGIYEMVVRRCKYIVVVDAGADDRYTNEDLGSAIRKIRIDLGVSIEFPWGLDIDKTLGAAGMRCALGKIRYDERDDGAEPGEILYIKPVLTGTEPRDITTYHCGSGLFPQEPTSDQWFTESQFESYRRLGAFSIEEIVDAAGPMSVPDLFRRAAHYLSNHAATREHVRTAAAGEPM
jgi:Patatin-like phospholipase